MAIVSVLSAGFRNPLNHILIVVVGSASCLLQSCKVAEPEIVRDIQIVERTVRIDSMVVEFMDTTVCPPNLTDTLIVTKVVTRRLPPRDLIIKDTITLTQTRTEKIVQRIAGKVVTKNNWWLLAIGLIIGFYAKNYIRPKAGDM